MHRGYLFGYPLAYTLGRSQAVRHGTLTPASRRSESCRPNQKEATERLLLFSYWGKQISSRLSASQSHRRVTAGTPTRRGLTFVRAKVSKTRLGRCPKTPVAGCAGYGLILRREPEINPYCAQNRSQGSHGRICPFPPPPFPMAGKGPGWAGNYKPRVTLSGC